ncbi:MAG: ABC transporter ATP-binding protein [Rhodobiaceae bacterium]|nr:ABC transporter ATP-binding protein [Rhodobiaceae bacterium]
MIEVRNVTKMFGAFKAVDDCSIAVEAGSITGLIGPNGAGKTTLFNIIAGAVPPTSGRVLLDGQDITALPAHARFERGLLRTFQIAQEFSRMTVLENLMVVPPNQTGEKLWNTWFKPGRIRAEDQAIMERADEVLDFLKLTHVRNELAGNLSGGQKKLLELGRTLMTKARVVLLDEIAAGVNRTLLKALAADIRRLNEKHGYTFFMIEHDMDLIGELCHPVIVMAEGSVMTHGRMEDIRQDEAVIDAYFGGGRVEA